MTKIFSCNVYVNGLGNRAIQAQNVADQLGHTQAYQDKDWQSSYFYSTYCELQKLILFKSQKLYLPKYKIRDFTKLNSCKISSHMVSRLFLLC